MVTSLSPIQLRPGSHVVSSLAGALRSQEQHNLGLSFPFPRLSILVLLRGLLQKLKNEIYKLGRLWIVCRTSEMKENELFIRGFEIWGMCTEGTIRICRGTFINYFSSSGMYSWLCLPYTWRTGKGKTKPLPLLSLSHVVEGGPGGRKCWLSPSPWVSF